MQNGPVGPLLLALERLPDDLREVVYLRLVEKRSVAEVAEALEIEPAEVERRSARGRERLERTVDLDGLADNLM